MGRFQERNLKFQYHICYIRVNKIFTDSLNCVLMIKEGSTKIIAICFWPKSSFVCYQLNRLISVSYLCYIWVSQIFTERLNCVLMIKVGSTNILAIFFWPKPSFVCCQLNRLFMFSSQPFQDHFKLVKNLVGKKCYLYTEQINQFKFFCSVCFDQTICFLWPGDQSYSVFLLSHCGCIGCEIHKSSLCL